MIKVNTSLILFTHKRPYHTKQILDSINNIIFKNIYIVSDGWRNKLEKKLVLKVRSIINKNKFSCRNIKFFLDKNIGIRNIFQIGLDWAFKYEDRVIILEDDTKPNQFFFRFCDQLLIKYKNKKKISMICGTNFKSSLTANNKNSYFFSKYSFIWGWATWKDRWELYDNKLEKWDNYKKSISFKKYFRKKNEAKFWKKNLDFLRNNIDKGSWDFPLTFSNFYHKKLSIVPKNNLVTNIGYDAPSGINPKKNSNLNYENLKFPLKHPIKIKTLNVYDNYCSKHAFSLPSFKNRVLNKLKKIFIGK